MTCESIQERIQVLLWLTSRLLGGNQRLDDCMDREVVGSHVRCNMFVLGYLNRRKQSVQSGCPVYEGECT